MFIGSPGGPMWGALFTALALWACVTDVRSRRIPNALVLAITITGLAYSLASRPLGTALALSSLGFLLGLALWIAFWFLGLLGAGDVKFFAATGAWLGPGGVWRAAVIAALAGGVLALVALRRERRLGDTTRRFGLAVLSATPSLLAPGAGPTGARSHIPYGLALAAGVLSVGWVPALFKATF